MNNFEKSITAVPTLIIGLGGTGVKVAQKLKTQILQKTPELISGDGGNVMFFCLDTQPYSKEHHNPLTKAEYMPIGIDINPQKFVERNLKADGDFGIKTVWPEVNGQPYDLGRFHPITMGASQERLVGRVALFSEAGKVVDKISSIIKKFFQLEKVKVDDATSAQIHVIGSIAGGTGSSLIFDVPYLLKLAAHRENRNIFITGHFIMSGAFDSVLKGSPTEVERCAANTYTCLKEMDYFYRTFARELGKGKPLWEVKYTRSVGTIEPDGFPHPAAKETAMDWVNLYDKTNEHGYTVTDPDHMFDIIAQGISYGINGGVNRKSISAIDNALDKTLELTTKGKAKPYCSMGVAALELPLEGLQKYLGYTWTEQLARKRSLDRKADEFRQKAEREIELEKRKQYESAASTSLMGVEEFADFTTNLQVVLDEKAEMILAEGEGRLEQACMEKAKEELKKLNFHQFVKERFIATGKEEEFLELVRILFKKAGTWCGSHKGKDYGHNFVDSLEEMDFLLYPEGAEDIREIIENALNSGYLDCPRLEFIALPENVGIQGIVKTSTRFGFPLESLEAFEGRYKEAEQRMQQSCPFKLRSILKEYGDFPCPLDDYQA